VQFLIISLHVRQFKVGGGSIECIMYDHEPHMNRRPLEHFSVSTQLLPRSIETAAALHQNSESLRYAAKSSRFWNHLFFTRKSLKATMSTLAVDNLDENGVKVGENKAKAEKAYEKFKEHELKADTDWPSINSDEQLFESIQRILVDYLTYRLLEADAVVGKHKVVNNELPIIYDIVCDDFLEKGITSPDDTGLKGLTQLKNATFPLLANVLKTLEYILPQDLVGAIPMFKQDIMRLQKSASPTPKGVRLVCFLYVALFLGARGITW
jgi:hypothetical protein